MSNWAEKGYGFFKEISDLTGNVKALQDQMERVLNQVEKSRDEIRDLKADIRVLEKEIQTKAMETVVNAHAQIIERVVSLEFRVNGAIPHDGRVAGVLGGPLEEKPQ
jgi:peptidoglycan hydrolase CwlO-like protein